MITYFELQNIVELKYVRFVVHLMGKNHRN